MKDSEALRKAKTWLELQPATIECGVCRAINVATGSVTNIQAVRLKRWIVEMIGFNNTYLSSWLVVNGHATGIDFGGHFHSENRHKLKATRLAWLDWMIAECEKAEVLK